MACLCKQVHYVGRPKPWETVTNMSRAQRAHEVNDALMGRWHRVCNHSNITMAR